MTGMTRRGYSFSALRYSSAYSKPPRAMAGRLEERQLRQALLSRLAKLQNRMDHGMNGIGYIALRNRLGLCSLRGLACFLALLEVINAHGARLVARDIDDGAHHVEHAVNAGNQSDALDRQADRLQHHG